MARSSSSDDLVRGRRKWSTILSRRLKARACLPSSRSRRPSPALSAPRRATRVATRTSVRCEASCWLASFRCTPRSASDRPGPLSPPLVRPREIAGHVPPHGVTPERDRRLPKPLILRRPNEPFDDGSRPGLLSRRRVPRVDSLALAPGHERATRELAPFIGENVLRSSPVRRDDVPEESTDVPRGGPLRPDSKAHDVARPVSGERWGC
jgi:hypothetical protein